MPVSKKRKKSNKKKNSSSNVSNTGMFLSQKESSKFHKDLKEGIKHILTYDQSISLLGSMINYLLMNMDRYAVSQEDIDNVSDEKNKEIVSVLWNLLQARHGLVDSLSKLRELKASIEEMLKERKDIFNIYESFFEKVFPSFIECSNLLPTIVNPLKEVLVKYDESIKVLFGKETYEYAQHIVNVANKASDESEEASKLVTELVSDYVSGMSEKIENLNEVSDKTDKEADVSEVSQDTVQDTEEKNTEDVNENIEDKKVELDSQDLSKDTL